MTITVIGATGKLGGEVIKEALLRGHTLRGIAPDGHEKVVEGVEMFVGGADDMDVLMKTFKGSDVVVLVFPPSLTEPERYPAQIQNVIKCIKASGVNRLVALMGSSGALVGTGERLVETDYFAETTRHFYLNIHDSWDVFRNEKELDWSVIVPAARMEYHLKSRNGQYRTRTDEYLVVTDENSRRYFDVSQIAYADCAAAMVDECEKHMHTHEFVCVGY